MTLDQIVGAKSAELEAYSDEQIEAFFKPFFDVTRPPENVAKKSDGSSKISSGNSQLDMLLKLADASANAKKLGIDISSMVKDISKLGKK